MRYRFERDFHLKKGVVSNLHGFVYRHMDTGFKTKWSGFWVPPYKYLDYYGIKLNGVWLGPETLEASEYGDSMVFHHRTDFLIVHERVKVPEGKAGFEVELEIKNTSDDPKAVKSSLKAGIDIREKSEDLGPKEYNVRREDNIEVEKDGKKLVISGKRLNFQGEPYIQNHKPGEQQRCLIPGELFKKIEIDAKDSIELSYRFDTGNKAEGEQQRQKQVLEKNKFGRCLEESVRSMENLEYNRNGYGIIAGHPWFQSYWARDTFWTLLGYIDAGHYEKSEKILTNFAEKGVPGKIALEGTEKKFPRSDTEPLFIIASEKLRRHYKINDGIREARKKAINALEMEENIVAHDPMGTWMDTLERSPAIDIQSLWLEAARIMNDERAEKLEKGMESFKGERYPKDYLGEDSPRTVNPAVPMMLGHFERKEADKYLEKMNAEFSSYYGARTQSSADPGYESDGYHTGSAWGLTSGWAAAANAYYGKEKRALNFMERMRSHLDRNQPGALPEVNDSESGRSLGCDEQAWSAGMFVHVIDSYILGMTPEDGILNVDPFEDFSCIRRNKRVEDQRVDLKFERGEVEVIDGEVEIERC